MVTQPSDSFDLPRFVRAQDPLYSQVLRELRQGRKTSHWMWFVFPQLRGLGFSSTAHHFGITSRAEAEAYLEHPLLGARLRECTALVLQTRGKSAREIFGSPDDMKFRSSATLFAEVSLSEADVALFISALTTFYEGAKDERTLSLLSGRT